MAGFYPYYRRWDPYVPVAERRRRAATKIAQLVKKGRQVHPVAIEGRRIATTFWGQAWCENLEAYSDFENRLPRGRTYVRNGSVMDLQIEPGQVSALVAGRSLYTVSISIRPVAKRLWKDLTRRCAGRIESVVELLEGRLSEGVMGLLCGRGTGLFPKPREMTFKCSCPDWASMCKHVSAALYGVGARLDEEPELLFVLRQADHRELIAQAAGGVALGAAGGAGAEVLDAGDDLGDLFGIELEGGAAASAAGSVEPGRRARGGPTRGRRRRAGAASPEPRPAAAAPSRARRPRAGRTGAKPSPGTRPRTGGRAAPEAFPRRGARRRTPAAPDRAGSRRAAARGREPVSLPAGSIVTPQDLLALGVPRSTFQNWPLIGVLERTGRRGVYRATARTRAAIERALARKPGAL